MNDSDSKLIYEKYEQSRSPIKTLHDRLINQQPDSVEVFKEIQKANGGWYRHEFLPEVLKWLKSYIPYKDMEDAIGSLRMNLDDPKNILDDILFNDSYERQFNNVLYDLRKEMQPDGVNRKLEEQSSNTKDIRAETTEIYLGNLTHDIPNVNDGWLQDTYGEKLSEDDDHRVILRVESGTKKLVIIYSRNDDEDFGNRDQYGKRVGMAGVGIEGAMVGSSYEQPPEIIRDSSLLDQLDKKYRGYKIGTDTKSGEATEDILDVVRELEDRHAEF